jgi:hypothetical protein
MKTITKATVQAPLKNEIRKEVKEWCEKNFGVQDDDYRWCITSNYARDEDGDFDVIFWNMNDAHWFILKWGGVLADVEYEETFAVCDEVFDNLFEAN